LRLEYFLPGALKTNRGIYPHTCRLSHKTNEYARTLSKDDCHLVTVGKSSYYVHRYQGKLNGLPSESVVIISWPEQAFSNEEELKSFISTDLSLDELTILKNYCCRWPIEVFIRQCKMKLGLNKYQAQTEKAFTRYWIIIILGYIYMISKTKLESP